MWSWVKDLDRILRGDATRLSALRKGTIEIPAGGLSPVILVLAMLYGACMGCFAVFRVGGPCYPQLLATTLKVPALFFLTFAVTFPSLYVFNALVGSQLKIVAVLRLLVASLAVNLAVLASLGPIVAFFSLSTTSYSFMVLLNVLVYSASGILGLTFLLQTLHRLSVVRGEPPLPAPPPPSADQPQPPEPLQAQVVEEHSALDALPGHMLGRHVKTVFQCWVVIFGLVGAQMGWVLRPFVGNPSQPFDWFRPRESNFFEAILLTLRSLFS